VGDETHTQQENHDDKGRFRPGNPGGPGRPSKAREQTILQIGRAIVTLERWKDIFEKAYQDATKEENGLARDKARRFLAEYFIGKPAQTIRVQSDGSPDLDEYADLSDDELRAIAATAEAATGSSDGTEGAG
jgi:hypothetical protein